jgi:hypothetical protein
VTRNFPDFAHSSFPKVDNLMGKKNNLKVIKGTSPKVEKNLKNMVDFYLEIKIQVLQATPPKVQQTLQLLLKSN